MSDEPVVLESDVEGETLVKSGVSIVGVQQALKEREAE